MRPCVEVKTQKYYTHMSLMLLRHIVVLNVKLATETKCARWGLKNPSPREMLLNYTHLHQSLLSIVYCFSESGHLVLARSNISLILAGLGPPGSNCVG